MKDMLTYWLGILVGNAALGWMPPEGFYRTDVLASRI